MSQASGDPDTPHINCTRIQFTGVFLFQDLMVKFGDCSDALQEFNNVSADVQKAIKLEDGNTKDIESDTNKVNSEFAKRRNRLHFHEKLIKGFDRNLNQFKSTTDDVEKWSNKETKEVSKLDAVVKDTKTAKADLLRIDVSLIDYRIVFESFISQICLNHQVSEL